MASCFVWYEPASVFDSEAKATKEVFGNQGGNIMKTGLVCPCKAATRALVAVVTAVTVSSASGQALWINEFHYDNTGTDVDEFVEIAAPESLTELASVRLTLYNGGDGKPYGSSHLLSSFTPGESLNGIRFYSKLIPGLQNGAPDGMSLDVSGDVRQFISYEGLFSATGGPAVGRLSVDVGIAEPDTFPVGGSLSLTGIGGHDADFVWTQAGTASPGGVNPGQTVVPEPGTYALFTAGGLVAWAGWRRRHRTG